MPNTKRVGCRRRELKLSPQQESNLSLEAVLWAVLADLHSTQQMDGFAARADRETEIVEIEPSAARGLFPSGQRLMVL